MAAAVERHEIVTEGGEVGRKKACGADVKVHLIAMAIHYRTLARTIRSVVGSIQRMSRRRNADKFSAHEKLLDYKQTTRSNTKTFCPKNPNCCIKALERWMSVLLIAHHGNPTAAKINAKTNHLLHKHIFMIKISRTRSETLPIMALV